MEVDIPNEGKCTVRGQLLCAIMDLPAKAAMSNCTQYNGYYGCSGCKHPGVVVSFLIRILYSFAVSTDLKSVDLYVLALSCGNTHTVEPHYIAQHLDERL